MNQPDFTFRNYCLPRATFCVGNGTSVSCLRVREKIRKETISKCCLYIRGTSSSPKMPPGCGILPFMTLWLRNYEQSSFATPRVEAHTIQANVWTFFFTLESLPSPTCMRAPKQPHQHQYRKKWQQRVNAMCLQVFERETKSRFFLLFLAVCVYLLSKDGSRLVDGLIH